MKPVFQTRFGFEGNCFAACLASLFELDLDQVPLHEGITVDPARPQDWRHELDVWLDLRGYFMLTLNAYENGEWRSLPGHGLMLCGLHDAPRDDRWAGQPLAHAVVVHNGTIVHDPAEGGLRSALWPLQLCYFIALDPAKGGF